MKEVYGNLIDFAFKGDFDMIMHGANTHHIMGAGIAYQIAKRIPEMKRADDAIETPVAGSFSTAPIWTPSHMFIGVNLYTQKSLGANFEIELLKQSLKSLSEVFPFKTFDPVTRIGIPLIGCGIGGGNESEVLEVFKKFEIDNNVDLTLVRFDPNFSCKEYQPVLS